MAAPLLSTVPSIPVLFRGAWLLSSPGAVFVLGDRWIWEEGETVPAQRGLAGRNASGEWALIRLGALGRTLFVQRRRGSSQMYVEVRERTGAAEAVVIQGTASSIRFRIPS